MFGNTLRKLLIIVLTPLLVLTTAGISLAHDTGTPHTHASYGDEGVACSYLDGDRDEDGLELHFEASEEPADRRLAGALSRVNRRCTGSGIC